MTTPRRGAIRRALLASLTLAATAAVAAPAAQAAPAATTRAGGATALGIPSDCNAGSLSVSSNRYRYFVYAYGGRFDHSPALKQKALPFQPRHLAPTGSSFAGDASNERHLVTDSAGRLYVWKQFINEYAGTGSFTMTRISGSWASTQALTASKKYIYRANGDWLVRYTIGSGGIPRQPTVAAWSGFGDVKTMSVDYSTTQADTIVATTTSGELLQIKVRRTAAASVTSRTLRTTGYQNFVTFESGQCWDRPRGGAYFGVTKGHGVYAYYDANRTDTSANLIGGRVGSWSQRTY